MYKISDKFIKFNSETKKKQKKKQNKKKNIDRRRKNISWRENPVRYLPGRYVLTITICNRDRATQSHTWKLY